jgi:hypothetical protein
MDVFHPLTGFVRTNTKLGNKDDLVVVPDKMNKLGSDNESLTAPT